MAWSTNGITFDTPTIFQDSAGVPSVIRWKGDTLIAAFQWFRLPNPSPTWDRVAAKFSYDNGLSWTPPTPIVISGIPANYQRPFDPTLTVFAGDSLRIYFSSSEGLPMGGLNASVNTYSAKSADGIHFVFESGARVDVADNRVIDPAVIYFNNSWHYASPIGSPQQGAYHYVSPNGLNFSPVPNIPSDNSHNWTGNYLVESNAELRFYGSGPFIWYNSTPNGGVWNGFVHTNIQGGDPSVVKISPNNYLMIFVGQPYVTATQEAFDENIAIFPNPVTDQLNVQLPEKTGYNDTYLILYDATGKPIKPFQLKNEHTTINTTMLISGVYFYQIITGGVNLQSGKIIKK